MKCSLHSYTSQEDENRISALLLCMPKNECVRYSPLTYVGVLLLLLKPFWYSLDKEIAKTTDDTSTLLQWFLQTKSRRELFTHVSAVQIKPQRAAPENPWQV